MIAFGTNRFGNPDPAVLVRSVREAEAAGFDHLWFPDSQLHAFHMDRAARMVARWGIAMAISSPW